ncbi:bifunctional folylpolyglutamate synthase/dihydrofolate synthase [Butyrivibrio sp. INlla14]|uniref:bifunctional folylpolyglutamate synthase/dihydrofolate synthase n=1 Tax=Butyrivibrio sp. INlla14 TaxID=1520808 RepID=UPI00087659D6|nr:folylpolyglutamate synthase/dihydrofolate synthase family protein [Butyrivibrio sp. INlla14]SCY69724.1 dihydrofolate synthase / folylpolyglutamate synthase [Butyrivibrio sp. INlla14]
MEKIISEEVNKIINIVDGGRQLTLRECEEFLNSIPSFTTKHTIEDTRDFLKFLGNPEENMKIIHVAGTNGKGSVCCYISSVLMKAGYEVGMFTSPHLVKITERFQVDGKQISDGLFAEIFVELLRRIMEYSGDYFPTYFEFLFFMAMLLYDVYPVDYLVLETGLGGRLDATNSVEKPLLSVITEIGYDHMQYLGNTLEEIAGEKAGIIKKGVPVVLFDKRKETTEVIKKKALEIDTRTIIVENRNIEDIRCLEDDNGNKHIAFSLNSLYDKYVDLELCTRAVYQTENAAIAVAALEVLRDQGADISELDIREGLLSAKWEGRMEEVRPGVFVDGAHNIDGISAFLNSSSEIGCDGRKLMLFGIVDDKQYRDIIARILESRQFDSIFVSVLETSRSVSVSDLKAAFEDTKEELGIIGVPVKYYSNVRDAITDIITVRKSGDMVFAAGSLYLAGQIKEML